MCGRFTRRSASASIAQHFHAEATAESAPSYNVAPSQTVLVARCGNNQRQLAGLRWGLVPAWSQGPDNRYTMINARAESVADKPAYRRAFQARRCLIAADGFYEWQRQGRHKQPYFFYLEGQKPFAFAGLWERWQGNDQIIESCTLITTTANAVVEPVHPRMPVILAPDDYSTWLEADDPVALQALLVPCALPMAAHSVGLQVNNPRHDANDCIDAV